MCVYIYLESAQTLKENVVTGMMYVYVQAFACTAVFVFRLFFWGFGGIKNAAATCPTSRGSFFGCDHVPAGGAAHVCVRVGQVSCARLPTVGRKIPSDELHRIIIYKKNNKNRLQL